MRGVKDGKCVQERTLAAKKQTSKIGGWGRMGEYEVDEQAQV